MADEKREFARNYDSCFVAVPYKQGPESRAFCVRGVNTDGSVGGVMITPSGKEAAARVVYETIVKSIRPIVPSGGYFNVLLSPPNALGIKPWVTALFVDIAPERQFRKGLAGDVRYVRSGVSMSPHFRQQWMTHAEHAGGVYPFENKMLAAQLAAGKGRELVSLRQAADMVESGEHFIVAFSKFFAMSLRQNFAHPVILSNNEIVGVYAQNAVWGTDKIFHLADFFDKRWGVALHHITTYEKRKKR